MKGGVDVSGQFLVDAFHAHDILDAGLGEPLEPTEVPEKILAALGPHPADILEHRTRFLFAAPLTMPRDRKAVGLVPDLLHQVQGRGLRRQYKRLLLPQQQQWRLLLP